MKNKAAFPAITVFYDETHYWCVDGFHRVAAAKKTGETRINAIIRPGNLNASEGTWTHVASSCTPDEDTVDYRFSGAGVSFPGSVTGTITLRCHITNVMNPDAVRPWTHLEVVYRDPDGNGTVNQVNVALHKVMLNGDAETFVSSINPITGLQSRIDPSLITTFTSNTVASATPATQVHRVELSHTFDFGANAYYVKIQVKRAVGSTTNPAAFIVRLTKRGTLE